MEDQIKESTANGLPTTAEDGSLKTESINSSEISRRKTLKTMLLAALTYPLLFRKTKEDALGSDRPIYSDLIDDPNFTEKEILELNEKYPGISLAWSEDRVQAVDKTCRLLPNSFYSPRQSEPLKCILVPPISNSEAVYSPSNDTLYLNLLSFDPLDEKENLTKIAGALATRIVLNERPEILTEIDNLFEDGLEERLLEVTRGLNPKLMHDISQLEAKLGRSSYAEVLLKISGDQTQKAIRDRYLKGYLSTMRASKLPLSALDLPSERREEVGFNLRLFEMLSKSDPVTFINMMSGFYTLGETKFNKKLGQYFSNKETETIYKLLKNNIFDQKEYS